MRRDRPGYRRARCIFDFRNKDALFRAVIRKMVVPEIERAELRVQQHRGSQAKLLRDLALLWWQTVGESRLSGIPKRMVAGAYNFPDLARFFLEQAVRRVHRLFARAVRRGVANGEFRPRNVAYSVRLLPAPLVFAAIYEHSLRPYDREPYSAPRFIREHVELFLRGIAAPSTLRKSVCDTSSDSPQFSGSRPRSPPPLRRRQRP